MINYKDEEKTKKISKNWLVNRAKRFAVYTGLLNEATVYWHYPEYKYGNGEEGKVIKISNYLFFDVIRWKNKNERRTHYALPGRFTI